MLFNPLNRGNCCDNASEFLENLKEIHCDVNHKIISINLQLTYIRVIVMTTFILTFYIFSVRFWSEHITFAGNQVFIRYWLTLWSTVFQDYIRPIIQLGVTRVDLIISIALQCSSSSTCTYKPVWIHGDKV